MIERALEKNKHGSSLLGWREKEGEKGNSNNIRNPIEEIGRTQRSDGN